MNQALAESSVSAESIVSGDDSMEPGPQTCWVGVGSPLGDDRVGWIVIDRLRSRTVPGTEFVKLPSPVDLLDLADRPFRRWLICDAFAGPGPVGRLHHWRWPADELNDVCFSGSHDVSLPAALTLAGNLGRLPSRVDVWGIDVGPQPPGGFPAATPREGALGLGTALVSHLGPIVERLATACRDA